MDERAVAALLRLLNQRHARDIVGRLAHYTEVLKLYLTTHPPPKTGSQSTRLRMFGSATTSTLFRCQRYFAVQKRLRLPKDAFGEAGCRFRGAGRFGRGRSLEKC